jgi:hypothetical protein
LLLVATAVASNHHYTFKQKYQPFSVGRSGYTSLSIEEKAYARLRRSFDTTIDTEKSFTVWALNVMESAIEKERKLNKFYPTLRYVGNKTGGCIIEDHGKIIEISVGKNLLACSQDKGICKHVLFAVLHPFFEA